MERTFKFPKGCSVAELTIRTVTGKDEEVALREAENRGSPVFYSNELLRLSIVKIDGKPVGARADVESWNSRTRLFAKQAFNKLNSADDGEIASFLRAADEGSETAAS